MKKIFLLSFSLFVLISFYSCEESNDCEEKINEDCVCTAQYDPVCGCNGVTYSNACAAACVGVASTKGECKINKDFILGDWTFIGYKKKEKLSNDQDKKHKYAINALFKAEGEKYEISGRTAINFYGGEYVIRSNQSGKGKIQITGFIMTKIGGTEPDLSYETNYIDNLSSVTNFILVDNKTLYLEFSDNDVNDTMVFRRS